MKNHLITRRNFVVLGLGTLVASCTSYVPDGSTTPAQLNRAIIMSKINGVRAANGRAPLRYNEDLGRVAETQAQLMAARGELSHTIGGTLRERTNVVNYRGAVGENLAGGQHTLEGAIQGWLASSTHRFTLLNENFTEFGFAAAVGNGEMGTYWAMIFGGDAAPWLSS
jgi:uncharacterized protein YkwD